MTENWSYGNSYLRYLESPRKHGSSMTIFTLSERELQLALEDIGRYLTSISSGKAKIEIHHGTINISTESSKEMSL